MQTTRIALKNILIAVAASVIMSAVLGLFRDDWTAYFVSTAPSIATGLLAVASFWSAREGFEAGARSVSHVPPSPSAG
jgi:energy-converting hydrogenase Eha subunit A